MKFNLKNFIFYFFLSFFIIDCESALGKCLVNECVNEDLIYKNRLKKNSLRSIKRNSRKKSYFELLKNFEEDKIFLNLILASLIKENQNLQNKGINNFEVDILSEIQYEIENTFYAENNVEVIISNAVLKADKISYDREKQIFKVFGNIVFVQGSQYFISDYLEYNFKNKKGYIDNIYGSLDLLSLSDDFNYKNLKLKKNSDTSKVDIIDLPSEIQLLSSNNLRLRKKVGLDSLNFDFDKITKWRFKSERILLGAKGFSSELIYFTNDPFNKPQLVLKSKDFKGEIINNKSKLVSKKTSLILDDLITIPLGSRTIQDSESHARWVFGYDQKNSDGAYFYRSPFLYEPNEDFSLKLTPYFFIQRAILGETNSFREKNSSLYSDTSELKTEFLDYFGLKGIVKYKINDWDLNINSYLRTLNQKRLYDSFSSDLTLVKNLYQKIIPTFKVNKKKDFEYKDIKFSSKLNSNLALYSLYKKDDIHSAYGSKLINNFSYKKNHLYKNYTLIFDIGNFAGQSLESDNHLNLYRYGFITSLQHRYKILNLNPKKYEFTKSNRYSSDLIDQGLFMDLKIASGLYKYSNGGEQNNLILSIGPRIQYGQLKNRFLDYSLISVLNEYTFKNSQSPFKFDNLNEDSRIIFDFKQQFYGPILLGFRSYLNINDNSNNHGEFQNSTYSLGLSRRAYSANFAYRENDGALLLEFKIFNFGYNNLSPEF